MSLSEISDQLRQLLSSAGRSLNIAPSEPGASLVSRVNVVLMVFNDKLHQLQNGRWVTIAVDAAPGQRYSAQQLAQAAARLLQDQKPDPGSTRSARTVAAPRLPAFNIMLLLPPAAFLATPVDLPGVAPSALRAALELQSDNMLPGYDEPLSLAVHPDPAADNSGPSSAWWIPTSYVDALFSAFDDEELFLAAVMPRVAVCSPAGTAVLIEDQDNQHITACLCTGRAGTRSALLSQTLQTHRADLEDEGFAAQWQAEIEALRLSAKTTEGLHSAEDYLQVMRAQDQSPPDAAYAIYPASALAARHQFNKGKRLGLAAAALAGLIVLGAIPFLIQSFQLGSLQRELARQQELAAPARADQALVREFESRWGVLTEYPRQDIPAILLALQEEISPSVLTSLELDAGLLNIEGESSDPQNLLQQLEQNSMFTDVDFARATNNNRYYIDLRLTMVNYPAYQDWYFPEAN